MSLEDDLNFGLYIDSQFELVLRTAFPWMEIAGHSQSGPVFSAHMPSQNSCLKNSQYFYTESTEFFHITSIQNLLSILNGESIRLYNLHSSEDEDEFIYGANLLGLSEREIKMGKENVFTFSFCPFSEINNREIWDSHSDNFSKAALVFEIKNDISKWEKFHISKVYYDTPEHFGIYQQSKKLLEANHPMLSFFIDLNPLIPFHKKNGFAFEKEVRLIGNRPFRIPSNYFKYVKSDFRLKSGRNRITDYIELPLAKETITWRNENTSDEQFITRKELPVDIFKTTPEIKITDILFGINCGIDFEEYDIFRQKLQEMILLNLGYHVNLSYNFFSC